MLCDLEQSLSLSGPPGSTGAMSTEVPPALTALPVWEATSRYELLWSILLPGCDLDPTLLNNAVSPAWTIAGLSLPTSLEFQAAGFEGENGGSNISRGFLSSSLPRNETKRKKRKV